MVRNVSFNEEELRKAQEDFKQAAATAADKADDKLQNAAAKAVDEAKAKRDGEKKKKFQELWKVPPRYEVKHPLGKGAYGCVCLARDNKEERKVAIKNCKHLLEDLIDSKRVLREISILSMLDHPHVVKLYDVVVPSDLTGFNEIYFVLELSDSDMKKLLHCDVLLDLVHVKSLFYNLLVGLNYIHSAGIWHRDLKPANCLINEDCSVKICDFGLARAVGSSGAAYSTDMVARDTKRHLTGHVVTRWYRAPELILMQSDYTEAIDVWSAGCIYAELLMMVATSKYSERAPLFPGQTCFPLSPHEGFQSNPRYHTNSKFDQMSKICDIVGTPTEDEIKRLDAEDARDYMRCFKKREGTGLRARYEKLDKVGVDLMEKMLVFDPRKRVSVKQALNHALFAEIRQCKIETTAKEPIRLDFEQAEEIDAKAMRKLFLREVRRFHPGLPEI
mmetsp:Transcript_5631/g.11447  ORF Transcript_5631/g.11447 Transcript_5631/m.11447 type:complete len:446 (+) Transcript_5631:101-1438(+)